MTAPAAPSSASCCAAPRSWQPTESDGPLRVSDQYLQQALAELREAGELTQMLLGAQPRPPDIGISD